MAAKPNDSRLGPTILRSSISFTLTNAEPRELAAVLDELADRTRARRVAARAAAICKKRTRKPKDRWSSTTSFAVSLRAALRRNGQDVSCSKCNGDC